MINGDPFLTLYKTSAVEFANKENFKKHIKIMIESVNNAWGSLVSV